jgi:hypothetical protein
MVMLLMAQQLEKPQNRPTAGTLFTVSNVARTWKLPKSKCQKKATPGSQPVDKIISPFAFCAKVLGLCTSHHDTGARHKIFPPQASSLTNQNLRLIAGNPPADLLRETIPPSTWREHHTPGAAGGTPTFYWKRAVRRTFR